MTGQAVEVNNLNFHYGKTQILQNVNIAFPKKKFSVLLGRNGSGKSTLFKVIVGLENYKEGSVRLFGKERSRLSFSHCARLLGFLPQFHKSVFPFKVRDVVLTGRAAFSAFQPSKSDMQLVENAVREMEITHLIDRPYTELSGGEQQLVMLARVLVQNPPIILLDEPTNHLDIYYQTYVMQKLKNLSRNGFTVIVIMHDPSLALLYADHCFFMKDKTVVYPDIQQGYYEHSFLEYVYNVKFTVVHVNDRIMVVPEI